MEVRYLLMTFIFSLLCKGLNGEQGVRATEYSVAGESKTLPCSVPNVGDLLKWRFRKNGTNVMIDAAQSFPGGIVSVFNQFDLPPGRSQLVNGMLTINDLTIEDEGEYWCEISSKHLPSSFTDRIPLHIWVTPRDPQVVGLVKNGTVLEHTKTSVARCSSKAGKPESSLTWMNGSVPLVTSATPVVSHSVFSNDLWDISLDLILEDPTRFDHERIFQCIVEHPAYKGESKSLNHSVKVLYHPVNIRIWANTTSLVVYCKADGYPEPTYSWVIPGDLDGFVSPSLQMSDLYELPGHEWFECTADNGIPEPLTTRILVDDLRWPDGKPELTFAGLPIYIWAAIGGAVVLAIIVIVIIVCCCCKKKKKASGYKTSTVAKYSKPTVDASGTRHSQLSLLESGSLRTPDGRESTSIPPSEVGGFKKSNMARSYSLEHLVEEKYGGPDRNSVMLVPLNKQLSRDNMYADSSLNRRASREMIDKRQRDDGVADHIETLNKSWDNLAHSREQLHQSREQLHHSREELHVDRPPPPRYESHDDLRGNQYGSRERLNDQDSYPYMDDTVDRRGDRRANETNSYQNPDYYERYYPDRRNNYDTNDNYGDQRGNYGDGNNYNSNYGASDGDYNQQQGYSQQGYSQQGYNDQHNHQQGYNDQHNHQQGYNDNNYNQYNGYDDRNRNPSNDSEFDDDDQNYGYDQNHGYDYDSRGYQQARIV